MMLGLIKPNSGGVYINGHDINRDPMNALCHVGAIVETPAFYGYLSGRANLGLLGKISGGVALERVDEALELVGLLSRADDKVRGYSQGMRQRLGIAQALLAKPDIVILDEPTNGLDPSGMLDIRKLIRRLAKNYGITVFLSSHLLHEVEAVCHHVAVINNGALVVQGAVDELLKTDSSLSITIKVSDKEKGLKILGGLEYVVSIDDENGAGIEVRAHRDKAGELNRALVEGGVEVYALIPHEASLEEFFLELTGGHTGDKNSSRGRTKNA